ncbi:MAG: hypothetical protein K9J21_06835 [Bacteroidales bacterium]|nr:hypothetical protein [Bacteroidales bacterium]
MIKIELEDKGQDFLYFIIEKDKIIEAGPFQNGLWKGSYVPEKMLKVGGKVYIHKPPYINFGVLNYRIERMYEIQQIADK